MTDPESLIGQQVHFLGSITVPTSTAMHSPSALMQWGDTLTVTDEILEAGFDRKRAHWLELADDEAGQIARWGDLKFGLGPWPDYLPCEDPDHPTLAALRSQPWKHHVESIEHVKPEPVENTLEIGLRRGY